MRIHVEILLHVSVDLVSELPSEVVYVILVVVQVVDVLLKLLFVVEIIQALSVKLLDGLRKLLDADVVSHLFDDLSLVVANNFHNALFHNSLV